MAKTSKNTKRGAPLGNTNACGHKGNPRGNVGNKGNRNARGSPGNKGNRSVRGQGWA
eukprot:gene8116-14238_t